MNTPDHNSGYSEGQKYAAVLDDFKGIKIPDPKGLAHTEAWACSKDVPRSEEETREFVKGFMAGFEKDFGKSALTRTDTH